MKQKGRELASELILTCVILINQASEKQAKEAESGPRTASPSIPKEEFARSVSGLSPSQTKAAR